MRLPLAGDRLMSQPSANAKAVCAFNDFVRGDERVDAAMLTVGEGLTLLRKRR